MPKFKKGLTPQTQWSLILVGGLAFIYVGVHWRDFRTNHLVDTNVVSSAVITSDADRVEVARLNISAPIIYSNSAIESKIEKELQSGIVHLSGTANPGEVGNAYIVGHSSNYKGAPGSYNQVFRQLPEIKAGDEIQIIKKDKILIFQVYDTRVVQPTELWVMSQETSGERILTLQTSYPVGTAKMRFVAIARLKP
jgi:LPXTG-site transpeptidase (sortase) family protein